ncbi:hypothetical protein HK098_002384 [Nowakowskiella sp. JEL0407]|nr:hypothetical protein HK098_002384 [Nowakowskiella sp. JEL0407]
MISDFATLFVYNKARKAPDSTHPFGDLRITDKFWVGMGYHSITMITELYSKFGSDILKATSEAASSVEWSVMSPVALGILVASIFVKEALFRMTLRTGEKLKSDVLVANAYHHRADAASSIVALIGVGGSVMGWPLLDPVGGLIVSGMIVQTGVVMIVPAVKQLLDFEVPSDAEAKQNIENLVHKPAKEDKNVIQCSDIRPRTLGPYTLVDLQLQLNSKLSVSAAHQISENLRQKIMTQLLGVSEVLIHIDSEAHGRHSPPTPTHFSTSDIEERVKAQIQQLLDNDVRLNPHKDWIRRAGHVTVHFLSTGLHVNVNLIVSDVFGRKVIDGSIRDVVALLKEEIEKMDEIKTASVYLEIENI